MTDREFIKQFRDSRFYLLNLYDFFDSGQKVREITPFVEEAYLLYQMICERASIETIEKQLIKTQETPITYYELRAFFG